MKKIVIRSIRVAVVLAILCVSVELVLFKSGWFILLLLASIFFLDASDSMLVWRLKRITLSHTRTSLIYAYLFVVVVSACLCALAIASTNVPIIEDQYMLMRIVYPGLIAIFSFRYFVIVVRVMAKHLDTDEEY